MKARLTMFAAAVLVIAGAAAAVHLRSPALEEKHQQQVRAYFDKLRADARVTDGP